MSELRSAIEQFRARDAASVPDARLEEDFAQAQEAMDLLESARLELLAEIDRRRPFQRDGILSTAAWLAGRFRVAWASAREQVRTARALREMPLTRAALAAVDISPSAARVLAAARDGHPDVFAEHEEVLLDTARAHTVAELQRVVAYWRQAVDHRDALEPSRRLRDGRRLFVSRTLDGMVWVDGDLDPETGETVLTALRAFVDADVYVGGPDDRTRPSAGPTPWGRSAGIRLTRRIGPRWAASVPISPSRSTRARSRLRPAAPPSSTTSVRCLPRPPDGSHAMPPSCG